jgi:hypothetical protein
MGGTVHKKEVGDRQESCYGEFEDMGIEFQRILKKKEMDS